VFDVLLGPEPLIRLSIFAAIFAVMAGWETLAPRRERKLARGARWPGNIGIVALDTILVRLVLPTSAVGLALLAEARGWGLMHALGLPLWARRTILRSRALPGPCAGKATTS
jgi:hypothetical protein